MQRVHAVDGQGLVVFEVELREIEVGEIAGVMNDVELEGNAHEPRELLHSCSDFLHDALHGVTGSPGDDGG